MRIKNLIASLSASLTTVGDQSKDHAGEGFGKVYTYKTDLELEVGDEVIVDAPSTGLTVVKVARVDTLADINMDAPFTYKWVVGKVDVDGHKARIEKEAELEKEFAAIKAKARKMRQIAQLKADLGFAEDEKCDELDALVAKINAQ